MLRIITNEDKSMFGIANDDLSEFFCGFDVNGGAAFSDRIGGCAIWENVEHAKAQKCLLDDRPYYRVAKWTGPIRRY